jgi:hypothetical protein
MANGMVRLFVWAGMAALVKGFVDEKDESKFGAYLCDVTIQSRRYDQLGEEPYSYGCRSRLPDDVASGKEKLSNLSNFAAGLGDVYNRFLKEKSSRG